MNALYWVARKIRNAPTRLWRIATRGRRERDELRTMIQFLLFEVSAVRKHLRHVIADNPHYLAWIAQTSASFDYQWQQLPESENLLTNPAFAQLAADLVCRYTGLPASWFAGKKVLDAGCGNGRFSWAMAQLGAEVTAFDLSQHGTANLRRLAAEARLPIEVFQHNVLEPLTLDRQFDLVWSFGVLHHTGNTYRGFQHIQPLVRAGGYLFLMLYGEPRLAHPEDFTELNHYERLHRATQNRDFAGKIAVLENDPIVTDVHGWFDAISPCVNDLYSFEEIEEWLVHSGFSNVRRTFDNRHHFVIAQKFAASQPGVVQPRGIRKSA
jgi:2-polyprenyl-3-methyl-5-hydroxy-6-metoxy-1,4-benzoquinol methylase